MTIVCPVNISTMHIVRILLIRFLVASWLSSSLSLSLRFFLHCRKSIIGNLALQFVNVNCIPRIDTFDGQHDVQLTNDRIIISIDASIILSAHFPLYIHFLHAFSDECECCSEAEKTHSDCACASVCSPHTVTWSQNRRSNSRPFLMQPIRYNRIDNLNLYFSHTLMPSISSLCIAPHYRQPCG